MLSPSKLAIAVLLRLVATIKLASAHYCEWGTCNTWEYCCGENVCCPNDDVVFNVIIAVCASLGLLFSCCGMFFVCRYSHPMIRLVFGNYNNLSNDGESSTNDPAACDVGYDERLQSDPPPPYSEAVRIGK